ncbi:ABC transporter substrate-binding protein [Pusillimonas noertemannii]|uniref:ABC-type branched-subunit amino acid transport system substrate-binding protein n=1 Tax=Pusillimonas noertemannii TaxID=305977 RepID=A0A2U1CQV0_9BURK|nr:ABC transporter substrate-binding protein [Pusillimonas noertemannii]NYT67596.1 ABC transporter substrate-binding protein [Pusillimonas noertemannii]PVY68268.1 ABC-type branched-subunit amino acid transport system substrate-binding protein [Pusillimonas noertemannii]TFL12238.1 hypothetical protein CSC72_03745 [Pusillimonas noertemannii]
MKITSAVSISAACAAMIFSGPGNAQQNDSWVIGEIAPLSGPVATVGNRLNQVTKMWVDAVNANGGIKGRKIQLNTCNDEGKPEKAVSCARDLIDKGSILIINNSVTPSILATIPVVEKGPTMIMPSPTVIPAADSYVFTVSPSVVHLMKAMSSFLASNNVDELGMVAATDSTGEVEVKQAQAVFSEAGIKLNLARIDLRATDASSQLVAVASGNTKVVYSSYIGAGAATIAKSYSNLGMQQPLIVSYGNISNAFVDVIKDNMPSRLLAIGVSSLAPETISDPETQKRIKEFTAAYQARYGERVDLINLMGKVTTDTVDAVLRNVDDPADPETVKQYLETHPIPSIQNVRFSKTDHVGLNEKDLRVVEYKDGAWKLADPIK